MPIDLFEIENLFGDNNSGKVPNNIPTEFKNTYLDAPFKPNLVSSFGGSIRLKGSNGNYCKYKGRYYFLKRGTIRQLEEDPDECAGMYYLVDDVGTNEVLRGKVFVKGCVDIWNGPEELELHINRCLPLINSLARITRFSVGVTSKGQDYVTVKKAATNLSQLVLSNDCFNEIKNASSVRRRWDLAKKHYQGQTNKIYIFGFIKPTVLNEGSGKNIVKEKVNKFLERDNLENVKLVKISQAAVGTGSKLISKYALSYQDDSLGSIDDQLTLSEIDLSGLTDIVALDTNTLKKRDRPTKDLNLQNGVFDVAGDTVILSDFCGTFRRKAFLPHNTGSESFFFKGRMSKEFSSDGFDGDKQRARNGVTNAQRIYFGSSEFGMTQTAFLYHVDKLNFALHWAEENDVGMGMNMYLPELAGFFTHIYSVVIPNPTASNYGEMVEIIKWIVAGLSLLVTLVAVVASAGTALAAAKAGATAVKMASAVERGSKFFRGVAIAKGASVAADRVGVMVRSKQFAELLQNSARAAGIATRAAATKSAVAGVAIPAALTAGVTSAIATPVLKEIGKAVTRGITGAMPHWPYEYGTSKSSTEEWIGNRLGQDRTPGYGMLIFDIFKKYEDGNAFEYIGLRKTNKVKVFTGFNRGFEKRYSRKDEKLFGTQIDGTPLEGLTGNTLFSKFFLDIDNLLFRYFTPDEGYYRYRYEWYDNYGCYKLLKDYWNLHHYVGNLVNADLKGRPNPYKSVELYKEFALERERKIDEVTLKDTVILPFQLERGDYLFDTMNYDLSGYGTSHGLHDEDQYAMFNATTEDAIGSSRGYKFSIDRWFFRTLDQLEDFLTKPQYAQPLGIEEVVGNVVCCTNNKGQLEFRLLDKHSETIPLSDSKEQIIKTVNGRTSQVVDYYLLKQLKWAHPLTHAEINFEDDAFVNRLLAILYQQGGYNIEFRGVDAEPGSSVAKFEGYDEEDFNSDRGYLFDLVGTDWMAFIRNGKVHLISKDVNKFKQASQGKVAHYRIKEPEEILNMSLTERINRVNTIHYKTYPIEAKTKKLNNSVLSIEGFKATNLQSINDNYRITFKGDFDHYDERIAIPKEGAVIQNIGDQISLDSYELQMQNALVDKNVAQARIDNVEKVRVKYSVDRAKGDLDYERQDKINSIIMNSVGAIVGLTAASQAAYPAFKKVARMTSEKGMVTPYIGLTAGGAIGGLAGAGTRGVGGLISNARWLNEYYPEKSRRIEEDKKLSFRDIAYQSFFVNENELRARATNTLAIEREVNQYSSDHINDTTLAKEWIEKLGVGEVYVKTRTPSSEQLKLINGHYSEYGVDCEIYDMAVFLCAGMPENVIRFKFINDDGMTGISDPVKRKLITARLLNGFKIVEISKSNPNYEWTKEGDKAATVDITVYTNKIEGLSDLVNTQKQELEGEKVKIRVLTDEKDAALEANKKLTLETNTLRIQTQEQIDEVNRQLGILQHEKQTLDNLLHTHEEDNARLENEKTQLTADLRSKTNQLQAKTREVGVLQAEKADLGAQLSTANDRISNLSAAKAALEADNKKLRAKVKEQATEITTKSSDPKKKPAVFWSIEDYMSVMPLEKRNWDQIEEYGEEFVKYFNYFNFYGLNLYERVYEFLGMAFVTRIMMSLQLGKLVKAAGLNPKPIPGNSYFASKPNRDRFKPQMTKFLCGYEDPQDPFVKHTMVSSSFGPLLSYNVSESAWFNSRSNNSYLDQPNVLKWMMKHIITIVEGKLCIRSAKVSGNVELQNMARDRVETFNSVNGSIGLEAFFMNQYGLMNYTSSTVGPSGGYYSEFDKSPRAFENLYISMFSRNDVLINYIFNNGPKIKGYGYYHSVFGMAKSLARSGFSFDESGTVWSLFMQLIALNTGAGYARPKGGSAWSGEYREDGMIFTADSSWPDKLKDVSNFLGGSRNIAGENIKGPFYDKGKDRFNKGFLNLQEFEKQVHNYLLHNVDGQEN